MSKARLVAIVGTTAAALLTATVAKWEGKVNDPHWDRFGKVWDVCYGETRVPMRRYSDAECTVMLQDGLADFAAPVLKRNPELAGHPHQLAAAVSISYNVGAATYSRSTIARRFSEGKWRQACDAFLLYRFAGGKEVRGLLNRRNDERRLCLTNLPAGKDA